MWSVVKGAVFRSRFLADNIGAYRRFDCPRHIRGFIQPFQDVGVCVAIKRKLDADNRLFAVPLVCVHVGSPLVQLEPDDGIFIFPFCCVGCVFRPAHVQYACATVVIFEDDS